MVSQKRKLSLARYSASPAGKATRDRYRDSVKGRAAIARRKPRTKKEEARQNATPSSKAARARYAKTSRGRASLAKAQRRFQDTPKAVAWRKIYRASEHGKSVLARVKAKRRSCLETCIVTFTAEEWVDIQHDQNGKCLDCGKTCALTQDHIIPLTKGGHHVKENIQGLCQPCNSRKGNRIVLDLWK